MALKDSKLNTSNNEKQNMLLYNVSCYKYTWSYSQMQTRGEGFSCSNEVGEIYVKVYISYYVPVPVTVYFVRVKYKKLFNLVSKNMRLAS